MHSTMAFSIIGTLYEIQLDLTSPVRINIHVVSAMKRAKLNPVVLFFDN